MHGNCGLPTKKCVCENLEKKGVMQYTSYTVTFSGKEIVFLYMKMGNNGSCANEGQFSFYHWLVYFFFVIGFSRYKILMTL